MAYEYSQSAYSDTAFATYSAYLKSRIAAESATPSIAAASKSLSLTKALTSATKSNISATIQRENIQVLTGNATLTDKYNVIAQEFVRAQGNGDLTLAQSLEGQAYSLSQRIQYQNQQSAAAAAANDGRSWVATAKGYEAALKQFNADYVNAGEKTGKQVIADFVKSIAPQLAQAGIHLQPGVQPTYFDIVDGVNRAIYKSYQNASTVYAPTDPTASQTYADKADATVSSIPTIYGTMSAQTLAQAQQNPNMFGYKEDPQYVQHNPNDASGKMNPQTGYQQTAQGIQPTFSPNPWLDIPNNLNNQILSLKLRIVTKAGNGIEVTSSTESPQWIRNILPGDATTHILSDGNGQLQFEADAQNGQGKAIYTIAKDNTVWESSNLGDRLISGTPPSNTQPTSVFGKITQSFMSGMNSIDMLLSPRAFAATVPGMVQAGTNHFTLPPLPVAKPLQLPTLSVAAPAPQQAIHAAPPINPYPTAPTVSPQQTAPSTSIQSGGQGISLQGGGGASNMLQGGGGGISLQ